MSQNQNASQSTDGTVNDSQADIGFWRNRFTELLPQFRSVIALADQLGPLEPDFAHATGYTRVRNISKGRGGIMATAKAVRLMEQLLREAAPAPVSTPNLLKRQGLHKK